MWILIASSGNSVQIWEYRLIIVMPQMEKMKILLIKEHAAPIIALIASLFGAFTSIGQVYFDHQKRQENLIYERQIESLNDVVKSIDTLRSFVVEQKNNLDNSQQALSELKTKQEQLKPVLEADQKTVDAIFSLQAEQNKSNVWWERAIGFFIGISSSLVASLIWGGCRS